MRLEGVTISGADNHSPYDIMADLTRQFPFVEWGILFSRNNGRPRYPDISWISGLIHYQYENDVGLQLSAHYCGDLAKNLLYTRGKCFGQSDYLGGLPPSSAFYRVQLNGLSSCRNIVESYPDGDVDVVQILDMTAARLNDRSQNACARFVLQIQNQNDLNLALRTTASNINIMHDKSAGRGIPINWSDGLPTPMLDNRYTGYAGGICPDNIREVLDTLTAIADRTFWIDMETGVRSQISGIEMLDWAKVDQILKIANTYIS